MTVLVVYESMYGSTQAIAEAIGRGLAQSGRVQVKEVSALAASPGSRQLAEDVTLLVVGGPTHTRGMSRPSSREDAIKDAPGGRIISNGRGIREWIEGLTMPTGGTRVAAFETKQPKSFIPGSAAKAAEQALVHVGGRPCTPPMSFLVTGRTSGLAAGQVEAAEAWGRELGAISGVRPRR